MRLISLLWLAAIAVGAFCPASTTGNRCTFRLHSELRQQPFESRADYMKRLQKIASKTTAENTVPAQPTNTTRGTYQRAEDWDAEQKAQTAGWDERVQFDGLRNGNRFAQNEILRRNLKGF